MGEIPKSHSTSQLDTYTFIKRKIFNKNENT